MEGTARKLGLLTLGVALSLLPGVAAADGTISGVVVDGYTGQPVRGLRMCPRRFPSTRQ